MAFSEFADDYIGPVSFTVLLFCVVNLRDLFAVVHLNNYQYQYQPSWHRKVWLDKSLDDSHGFFPFLFVQVDIPVTLRTLWLLFQSYIRVLYLQWQHVVGLANNYVV